MKNALGALLLVLAAATARPCSAAPKQAEARAFSTAAAFPSGEDLLMKQIRTRALTQPDGGVTAFVKVATGQSIRIAAIGLDTMSVSGLANAAAAASAQSLSGLKPQGALAPSKSPKAKARPVKKAAAQLRAIKEFDQDWGEGKTKTDAVSAERRKSR